MPFRYDSFDQQVGLTNAPLTEHEAKHIRLRLQEREHSVTRIDRALMFTPQTKYAELQEDRAKIVALIDRYRIALAPYKRLPPEMLQHIFHCAAEGYTQSGFSVDNPPLLLCRICSAWRRTALHMPELWRSLHFFLEILHSRARKVKAAQMWFSHAGDSPLSLTLTDTARGPYTENFVKEVITPFSRKFRYLHLVLLPSQVQELFALPVGSLDRLEELYVVAYANLIHAVEVTPVPAWAPPIAVFGPSSRLRRFRVLLTPFVSAGIFQQLPWHQLEAFRCDSTIQAAECHEMLLSCQSLRKLHVRIFGITYMATAILEIPLPNITSLTVQLCDQEGYDRFFLPLVLPVLCSLMIYNYHGLPWSPRMYNGLLDRSRCELEELYLGTLDSDSRDILSLLQRTPSLKSITLSHNTPVEDDIFHRIGSGEIGGCLEQLFLKGKRELNPLLTMLEIRQRAEADDGATSRLRFVETHADEQDIEEQSARIRDLRDSGVEISLVKKIELHFHL